MSDMENIEHLTFNIQHSMDCRIAGPSVFGVKCSMLNVFHVQAGGSS
jgi:hypothetical protein